VRADEKIGIVRERRSSRPIKKEVKETNQATGAFTSGDSDWLPGRKSQRSNYSDPDPYRQHTHGM
jgi:hypothetical protein